jgi:hypothetical protein
MRQGGGWDCFDKFCCENPATCDLVCPKRGDDFALDLAEIGGFGLDNVGPLGSASRPVLPRYIPVIHTASKRQRPLETPWAALPLNRVCTHRNRRRYKVRFDSRAGVLEGFQLGEGTRPLLLAIGKDRHLERYWVYRNDGDIPQRLAAVGFEAAVAPNFSLFLKEPRTQHMHARKRSLLCASEFAQAGIAPILYLQAISDGDWRILGDFLQERKDVDLVCKEFQTGGASPEHARAKIRHVADLEQRLGRQLHLVAVGGARFVPELHRYLSGWTVVDSTPYMRAMKRRRLVVTQGRLRSHPALGAPVEELLAANIAQYQLWILRRQTLRVRAA